MIATKSFSEKGRRPSIQETRNMSLRPKSSINVRDESFAEEKPSKADSIKNIFKKSFCGDIFGSSGQDSMLGMMYRSRTRPGGVPLLQRKESAEDVEVGAEVKLNAGANDNVESGSEEETTEELNPRQNLARIVNNWTVSEVNDEHVIKEGGVHALIALAGFEDPGIKKWVASALCNLSSRDRNRLELINIGATSGVVTIAMHTRTCSWKLARYCAMTLCNLSIVHGGEASMAKCGAVSALYSLMSLQQHRLLPLSIQGLYNLTCVTSHYPNLERIIKALLTLPAANGFDAFPLQIKALVNCTRYICMRERLIEDGVLAVVTALTNSLPTRQNKSEIVFYLTIVLRALSETKACLQDLIAKGTVEIMHQLLPMCDSDSTIMIIKTLRNMLKILYSFPMAIYATAVNIITDIAATSTDTIALQYASSSLHIFTLDHLRNDVSLAGKVICALTTMLKSPNALTQFFCVAATGNMFFNPISNESDQLETLVLQFIEAGQNLTDLFAIQEFCVAFAKLSQEPSYIHILLHHNKLLAIIKLLLRTIDTYMFNAIIQESCCIAICRFCLKIDQSELLGCKEDIASLLFRLMEFPLNAAKANRPPSPMKKVNKTQSIPNFKRPMSGLLMEKEKLSPETEAELAKANDSYIKVLTAAISTIVAFAERKSVCYEELLAKPAFLTRLVTIALKNKEHPCIPRHCCATLAVCSFDKACHKELSSAKVLTDLFTLSQMDDRIIRELVGTVLCNISVDPDARAMMITSNVMQYLTLLSGTTNELLQELCARCICNLSCSVDRHKMLIDNDTLQTLLMISLVRSVSHTTKQLAARAMLNMLTIDQYHSEIIDAGVIRAFGTLAGVHDSKTKAICAKGFLLFSACERGRAELALRKTALQSLFGLLKSTKQTKMIVTVGKAVCNLLTSPVTRRAAVNAGALPVLKVLATSDSEELQEATARVIVILADDSTLFPMLRKEPLVSVLVYILEKSKGWVLECVMNAFTCLARSQVFRASLIERGCIAAIVHAIIGGKITSMIVAEEICRCLCLLSYESALIETMINQGHILVVLYSLYKGKLCNPFCAHLMTIILRNISYGNVIPEGLEVRGDAEDTGFTSNEPSGSLMSPTSSSMDLKKSQSIDPSSSAEPSVSAVKACTSIVEQEGFRLLGWLLHDFHHECPQMVRSVLITLHNLCKVKSLHELLVSQGLATIAYKVVVTHVDAFGDEDSDGSEAVGQDKLSKYDVFHLTNAIRLVSQSSHVRVAIANSKVVKILGKLLNELTELSRFQIVSAITQLAAEKECRHALCDEDTVELIIKLSHHAETAETQAQCSSALSSLSEHASINGGSMSSLLVLSLRLDANTQLQRGATSRSTSPVDPLGNDDPSSSAMNGSASSASLIPNDGNHSNGHSFRSVIIDGIERTSVGLMAGDTVRSSSTSGNIVTKTGKSGIAQPSQLESFKIEINKYAAGASIHSTSLSSASAVDEYEQYCRSRPAKMITSDVKIATYKEEAELLAALPKALVASEQTMLSVRHRPTIPNPRYPHDIVYQYSIKPFSVRASFGDMTKLKLQYFPLPSVGVTGVVNPVTGGGVNDALDSPSMRSSSGASMREMSTVSLSVSANVSAMGSTILRQDSKLNGLSVLDANGQSNAKDPAVPAASTHAHRHQNKSHIDTDVRITELIPIELNMMSLEKDATLVSTGRSHAVYEVEEVAPPSPVTSADQGPAASSTVVNSAGKSSPQSNYRRKLQSRVRVNRQSSFGSFDATNSPLDPAAPRTGRSSLILLQQQNSTGSSGRPMTPNDSAQSVLTAMSDAVSGVVITAPPTTGSATATGNFSPSGVKERTSTPDTISPMQQLTRASLRQASPHLAPKRHSSIR